MKPLTLDQLRTIAEGAALSLRNAQERFEARKPAYQDGFIPSWLTSARAYYNVTKAAYERALAEQADADAAREENAK
jgi:hypothetical protein